MRSQCVAVKAFQSVPIPREEVSQFPGSAMRHMLKGTNIANFESSRDCVLDFARLRLPIDQRHCQLELCEAHSVQSYSHHVPRPTAGIFKADEPTVKVRPRDMLDVRM